MNKEKHAIYIPAYSDGLMSMFYNYTDNDISKKYQPDFEKKKSLRIFNKELDPYFTNPYILISAGTQFRKENFREKLQIGDECHIFVDSGGFQLAMGTVNKDVFTDEVALKWSAANGNMFPILDRPAFSKLYDYDYSLSKSLESAEYYAKNAKSESKVLNVMQGQNKTAMEQWYKPMSKFKTFNGWGYGGSKGNLELIGNVLLILLNNGEFERDECEYFHLFGFSSCEIMLYMEYIQHIFNKKDIDVQLTYDSTSWNRGCVYGSYFLGGRFHGGITSMEEMNWTNTIDYKNLNKEFRFPCVCPICTDLVNSYGFFNTYNKKDELTFYKFNQVIPFHNLKLQMDFNEKVNKIVACNMKEVYQEFFRGKIVQNLEIIDKVFDNPKNPDNPSILASVFVQKPTKTIPTDILNSFGK